MTQTGRSLRALATNRALTRVAVTWELFVLAEYTVWIAMLVYAYDRGGATAAGIVAVAQLVPSALVAPVFATWADRGPVRVLVVGYALQTLGMLVAALALLSDGPPLVAYGGAILASACVSAVRPAQSALTPGLARTVEELTAFNAVTGWLENLGIMVAGALTGLGLALGGPGLVFAGATCLTLVAALLLLGLHAPASSVESDEQSSPFAAVAEGVAVLRRHREPRLLVALLTAEYVVIGAVDLLFVVVAIDVLGQGPEWTGYLNTAYGVGGVAASLVTVALLGRRLGWPLVAATTLLGGALAVTALSHEVPLTLLLLGLVGLGRAVLDVAARTLLQRSISPDLLGRVFGLTESLSMAGLAVGSLLVPLLASLGGNEAALVGTALVVPVVLLAGSRSISHLDNAARMPVVEIALLRSMPHFRALPTPEIEGLARAAERRELVDGEVLMSQGEPGQDFFAIAEGEVAISVDGRPRGTRTRPEGLGEIALLRRVPRTATVTARGPVVLYRLEGEQFLTVVTGHDATARRADDEAARRLRSDLDPLA